MDGDFVRNRLFQPFASTKPGGFGIGAFEARSLIVAMGGRLVVDSTPGEGSEFSIFLPAADAGRTTATETRMTDQKLPVLLIVEDDEGLQRQLKWAYDGYRGRASPATATAAIDALRAPRARGRHARPRPAARSGRDERRLRDARRRS